MVEDKLIRRNRKKHHGLSRISSSGIKVEKGCKFYSTNRDSIIGDKAGVMVNKRPYASATYRREKKKRTYKSTPDMSLDDLLSVSHALTTHENGRELDIDVYPMKVRKYVTQAIRSDTVDICLKNVNRQIVLKIRDEVKP
ncbi:MAG: hypothetical protein ACI4WX_03800 [Aristaeellaceae bacterium]